MKAVKVAFSSDVTRALVWHLWDKSVTIAGQMCVSKIFAELLVLMAFFSADFTVRHIPALRFSVFRSLCFGVASSWFLKGGLVTVSDYFPIFLSSVRDGKKPIE
jgi:hypothetical protein